MVPTGNGHTEVAAEDPAEAAWVGCPFEAAVLGDGLPPGDEHADSIRMLIAATVDRRWTAVRPGFTTCLLL